MKRKSLVMVLAAAMTLGCCSVNVMADDGVTIQLREQMGMFFGKLLIVLMKKMKMESLLKWISCLVIR